MPLEVRDAALLHDMLAAARRVLAYTNGRQRADFDLDPMFADAVVRRIEITGEAARGLSDEFCQTHPDIPWRAITTTRNILAHDYNEVDYDIIWRIAQDHLRPLIEQLESLLRDSPPPPGGN